MKCQFHNVLKILREEHNVTQDELAKYLNVSRSTIAGYESRNRQPDYEKLIALSHFFNVSVIYACQQIVHRYFPKNWNPLLYQFSVLFHMTLNIRRWNMPNFLKHTNLIKNLQNVKFQNNHFFCVISNMTIEHFMLYVNLHSTAKNPDSQMNFLNIKSKRHLLNITNRTTAFTFYLNISWFWQYH